MACNLLSTKNKGKTQFHEEELKKQDQKFIKKYTHKTPLKRMCKPEDVLNCVEFLINDKSDYITGQNIILMGV